MSSIDKPSTLSNLSQFLSTHRRALLISITIAAAATAGSFYLCSSNLPPSSPNPPSDPDRDPDQKKKRDAKKSKKNRKKSSVHPNHHDSTNLSTPTKSDDHLDPLTLQKSLIESLDPAERARHAFTLKTAGNQAYQSKQFDRALECYSKAIECEQKAVYYSNRAACYTNLNDPQAVIRDCSEALKLDKHYIKALNRRAAARELLGGEENLFLALCDFTACVILDEFRTDTKGATADRVMKRYATEKAKAILKDRGPRLPSPMIIRAYLDAFRQKPKPELPPEPNQADHTLMLAYDALAAFDYTHASTLFHEAAAQGPSTAQLQAHAEMMRATFLFLMGQSADALAGFNAALEAEPGLIEAWVRKASVDMELGSMEDAMADFERALALDPNDPDVYYHRGQVYNVTEQHALAIADYERSIELDRSFIFSHVQLAVAIYKTGNVPRAMEMFERYLTIDGKESESPEVHNYYGELLFAEKKYDEALARFESAINLEQNRTGPKNVLPWVNKALVHAAARDDISTAITCCLEALSIDSSCEVAIQQVAQLKLQSNQMKEALEWYERGIQVAMTEIGLNQFIQFDVAARAQIKFMEDYPEVCNGVPFYLF